MARTKSKHYGYEPDYAVPPGLTIQETIDALGISQHELSVRAQLSAKHVNQMLKGEAPITPETAIRLERVTGIPAGMWNKLEADYRGQLAAFDEKKRMRERFACDLEWLRTIPTRELLRRGAIERSADKLDLLQKTLAFFGVASVDAWKEGWSNHQFAFRKSLAFDGKVGALATWLRLGELKAQGITCGPYLATRFRSALDEIRKLTVEVPQVFVPRMTQLCSASGVAFVLVPEIRGAPVSGAARWLTSDKAMICLNLRGKRNDRFWFTFFHEAGHILNDSKKETFVDIEYKDDPRELAANRFAANHLIPRSYDSQLAGIKDERAVKRFAGEIGIAPGIVVGRLQRDEIIPYNRLNYLREKLQWAT